MPDKRKMKGRGETKLVIIAGVHRPPALPVQCQPDHQPPPVQPPLREGLRDHPVPGAQRDRTPAGALCGQAPT